MNNNCLWSCVGSDFCQRMVCLFTFALVKNVSITWEVVLIVSIKKNHFLHHGHTDILKYSFSYWILSGYQPFVSSILAVFNEMWDSSVGSIRSKPFLWY